MINGIEFKIAEIFNGQYGVIPDLKSIQIQETRKEFEGDFTLVVFPLVKLAKCKPEQLGETLGAALISQIEELESFNVVKGFLNLSLTSAFWTKWIASNQSALERLPEAGSKDELMVEYSSPNTNKPLHLGHIRNNLLGYSVAEILKASGKKVYKTQIINDRGIHICKSMLAWQRFGNGQTPESTGLKGDEFVGDYYVAFDKAYKEEVVQLVAKGVDKKVAEKEAPILLAAQEMLQKWEAGDEEIVSLWKTMNGWVYKGFDITYKNLGVDFDTLYYESDTYLLGKDVVADGLEKGVFYKKDDGSVWIDLTDEGLDEKIVLRSDGTAVYMTQDIGTVVIDQFDQCFEIATLIGFSVLLHITPVIKIR